MNNIFQAKAIILYYKNTDKKCLLNIFYNIMLNSSWQRGIYEDDEKVILPKLQQLYHLTTEMEINFIKLQSIL